jgi:hypothetical protein
VAAGAESDEFEPVAPDLKTLDGSDTADCGRVDPPRDVGDGTAADATGMRVRVGPSIVAGGPVSVIEFDREFAPDEGLEGLVDGCERDVGDLGAHCGEDVVSGRMGGRRAEVPVDGGPLFGVSLARGAENVAQTVFGGRRCDPCRSAGVCVHVMRIL